MSMIPRIAIVSRMSLNREGHRGGPRDPRFGGTARRRAHCCQRTYPDSVEYNFGARVDYAQLVKEFGAEGGEEQRRYAPPRLIGAEKIAVAGDQDEARICRKQANLRAALALYFAYYNFCRMHKSIRMTPVTAP
jgi:hypothetical protein